MSKKQEGNALYRPMAYCGDCPDIWHVFPKLTSVTQVPLVEPKIDIKWSFSHNYHQLSNILLFQNINDGTTTTTTTKRTLKQLIDLMATP